MPRVTVRYWASARAAADRDEELVDASTVAEVLAVVRGTRPTDDRFAKLLDVCLVIVDGAPMGHRDPSAVRLSDDSVIELLPPFAGGSA